MRCFTEVVEEELKKRGFDEINITIGMDIIAYAKKDNEEISIAKRDYPSVWFQISSTERKTIVGGKTLGEALFKYDYKLEK